jgi:putative membrane protein insertion efficiency factor
LREIPARIVILPIRGYQLVLSPLLPRACRYHPSCSQYAVDAVRQYGVFRGVVLATWRLLRCNPLSDGGYDPVERQRVFKARPKGCSQAHSGLNRPGITTAERTPSEAVSAEGYPSSTTHRAAV